jgi:thymidylate synthase (FAD)
MRVVEPKVFLIGETRFIEETEPSPIEGTALGLDAYLQEIGVPEWTTDAQTDAEALCEVMGRMCYRSWKPGMNPNVTMVRQGNQKYIGNIIKVKHGSVLEHSTTNWIFHNVSRVFTHELVRHRAGTAISQESLRFVRLEDLDFWLPTIIRESPTAVTIFTKAVKHLEELQKELSNHFLLDDGSVSIPFDEKKVITSAMRRIAPIGLGTSIGWSANFRTLRHVIEMRTSRHAEEEMRLVFDRVGQLAKYRYPSMLTDYKCEFVDNYNEWSTASSKV